MTRYQPTPREQAQRKKEALAERVEKLSRVRVLEAIRKKLPDVLSRPDLEMIGQLRQVLMKLVVRLLTDGLLVRI